MIPLDPLVGLVLLAAGALAALVVLRPWAALVLLLVVELTNTSEVAGARGVPGLYVATLAVATASLALAVRRGEARLVWSPVFVLAGVFLAGRALSLLVAGDVDAGVPVVVGTARDLLFLLVATALLCATKRYLDFAEVAVGTVAVLAGLSVVQEFVLHNSTTFAGYSNVPLPTDLGGLAPRHSGPQSDVNFWGRSLVLFAPLALSLVACAGSGRRRATWLVALGALCAGEYLTGSRGGLVALGAALVGWFLLAGRRYARLLLLAPLALVLLLAVPGVGSRLATLSVLDQAGSAGGDPSLVGRVAAQRSGLAMFADRPALGVGAGNFELVQAEYLRRLGLATSVTLAAHNLYLEMAAEGGLVGLAAWLLFYSGAAFVALRALVLSRQLNRGLPSPASFLAVGVLAGLAGWALASLFLHVAYLRVLLVAVALGAAIDVEARRIALARRATTPPASSGAGAPAGTGRSDGRADEVGPEATAPVAR